MYNNIHNHYKNNKIIIFYRESALIIVKSLVTAIEETIVSDCPVGSLCMAWPLLRL